MRHKVLLKKTEEGYTVWLVSGLARLLVAG
jgi:hypothetical protein